MHANSHGDLVNIQQVASFQTFPSLFLELQWREVAIRQRPINKEGGGVEDDPRMFIVKFQVDCKSPVYAHWRLIGRLVLLNNYSYDNYNNNNDNYILYNNIIINNIIFRNIFLNYHRPTTWEMIEVNQRTSPELSLGSIGQSSLTNTFDRSSMDLGSEQKILKKLNLIKNNKIIII